jgi:hypothetical protein
MPDVHRQASWLLATSPFDELIHAAKQDVYMTGGEPAISLACENPNQCKLPRRRFETHDQVVSCLSCLVVIEDGIT